MSDSPQNSRRPNRPKHPRSYRAIASEVGLKLSVNMVLALVAVSALFRLLPYNLAQKQKIRELDHQVTSTEERVEQLEADFNRYFDPRQTRSVMQEQNNRIYPNQRQVIWTNSSDSADSVSSTQSSSY
jgi:hypothetical protein